MAQTFGGVFHIAGVADPEGGSKLYTLLETRAGRAGPDDPRTTAQRWYDALLSVVDEVLAWGDSTPAGTPRVPEIIVHATPATVLGDDTAPPARLDNGIALSRDEFDRLSCDARWRRLLVDAMNETLDLGRSTRDWSPALRKVIRARDGRCRYADCPMPGTHIHHCTWWSDGGTTCADNGVLVCGWHHSCIHALGYQVRLRPDGVAEWTLPSGRRLESRPRGPTPALLL